MSEKQKNFLLSTKDFLLKFLYSGLIFILFAVASRYLFQLLRTPEIQLVSALPSLFAIIFGLPGITGCAVFSFISLRLTGFPIVISLLEIPGVFLCGLLTLLFWRILNKNCNSKIVRLDSSRKLAVFIATILIVSLITAFLVSTEMYLLGYQKTLQTNMLFKFLNCFIFSVFIDVPVLVGISFLEQKKKIKNDTSAEVIQFSFVEAIISNFSFSLDILLLLIMINEYYSYWGTIINSVEFGNRIFTFQGVFIVVFYILLFITLHYIEKKIILPISRVSKVARDIENHKDFSKVCEDVIEESKKNLFVNSEIGEFSRACAIFSSECLDYFKKNSKTKRSSSNIEIDRFQQELNRNILPMLFPSFAPCSEVDIYGTIKFSKDFCGDFYDYFMIDDTHMIIILSDVMGRGIEAAILLSLVRNFVKDKLFAGMHPEEFLAEINQQIYEQNSFGIFVSMWLGVLDTESGELTYINAGMTKPLYMKSGENFGVFDEIVDLSIGVSDETIYCVSKKILQKNDKLILFTKGIVEVENENGEIYGSDRIVNFFNKHKSIEVQELVEGLVRDVGIFEGLTEQKNDISIVALEYKKS